VSAAGERHPRVLLACDFHLRYSARLAGGLRRAGAEVALLTRDHDREFGGEPGAAQRFVREAIGTDGAHRALPGRVRSPRGWLEAVRLRRRYRAFAPEVVHLQESVGNDPRLLLAAGIRPRRYALTIHDPSPHPGDAVPRHDPLFNRALARGAGLIFTHGEALREELLARLAPRAPVVVVPHGIESAEVAPLPSRPSILFFGRISRYKGLDVLLDAMAAVWAAVPEATLIVAGEGKIAPHPALADPRVEVRSGFLPDARLPELFAGATCVALPYLQASQSGVGSLAKPHGRALVVSAVGGLPELVSDGSGLVVPPRDAPALAAALVSLLRDPQLARRLGRAGAETAARAGSWDAVAKLTLAAYREHLPLGAGR